MRVLARLEELGALDAFLDDLGVGLVQMLLVTGAIGIGKTTIWREGVDRARARGQLVLTAQPRADEVQLAYAGLSDLFEPVAGELIEALPPTQRRAVEFALLRAEPQSGETGDPRLVAVGVLGGLRQLSEDRPVLLGVDDLQWLDEPTRSVLSFALRRIGPHPVGMLASSRTGHGRESIGLDVGGPETTKMLPLEGLQIGPLRELLEERLDRLPEQRMLNRVFEAASGNPFFALELAAAATEQRDSGAELAVPPSLRGPIEVWLGGFDESVRRLLLAAALAPNTPSAAVLAVAGAPDDARASLERAVEAQILDIIAGRVHFREPLIRFVMLADSSGPERREAHRRLARSVEEPFERMRHLGLAATGPDVELAAAVAASALTAHEDGRAETAAELAELALALTPADVDEVNSRTQTAAAYRFNVGDAERARDLIASLILETAPGQLRAMLLARRALYERYSGTPLIVWAASLDAALAEAGDDVELRLRAHLDLGLAAVNGGDVGAVPGHVAALRSLVDDSTDGLLRSQCLAAIVWADFIFGHGIDTDLVRRALEGYEPAESVAVELRPTYSIATAAALAGELDLARTLLDREYADALRRGNDSALPFLTWELVYVETWAGNWTRALALADHGQRVAESADLPMGLAVVAASRALLHSAQGQTESTISSVALARQLGETLGMTMPVEYGTAALGALALSQGDPAAAHAALGPLVETPRAIADTDPGMTRFIPDEVEALVRLGDPDAAESLLANFGAAAERLGRGWAIAATARCKGLIAAARGEHATAVAAAELAVAASAGLGMPLEHGRALLVSGEVHRRARRKRRAHDHLTEAAGVFDTLGAVLWSARCRDELARTGLRSGPAPTIAGLTAAEQRVAELAVEGYTTKQIAATLFTGVRTVEAHLQRIYRKLSVHSRVELARRLRDPRAR